MAAVSASACAGVKTRRGCDCTSASSSASRRRLLPSTLMRLIVGYSTTRISRRLPCGIRSTLSNRPEARMFCPAAFNSAMDRPAPGARPPNVRIVPSATRRLPSISKLLKAKLCAFAAPVAKTTMQSAIQSDRTFAKPCARKRPTPVFISTARAKIIVTNLSSDNMRGCQNAKRLLSREKRRISYGHRIVSLRIVKVISDRIRDNPTNIKTCTARSLGLRRVTAS